MFGLITTTSILLTKYNCKYDYQWAKCEDSKLIQAWFQHIQATIVKYSVHKDDIYNFDETGFQMSVISMTKVITESNQAGRPRTTQLGNCEWVTVIKTICVCGLTISSLIIFEAVMHQAAWYKNGFLLYDWSISVSQNGWINNEIDLIWLKTVFNKCMKNHSVDQYRLLILDSHSSYIMSEFDQYCLNQSIIVLCMSLHSSHLLQLLDVDCFSVLKWLYRKCIETLMSLNINQIDKQKFLSIYQKVCTEALHQNNIQSGFITIDLISYNSDCILSLLHIQYHMSSL